MGTGFKDPSQHTPWRLVFYCLLPWVYMAIIQRFEVGFSGAAASLHGTQGASVWFHVIRNPELPPEVELEKISWGNVSRANYIVMLHVFPGRDVPEWVNFQDNVLTITWTSSPCPRGSHPVVYCSCASDLQSFTVICVAG
uniref:Uncharacterized protein n=1 Tax=Otarine gammaherpesvirus 4 TaxID=2801541 RepID=A0A889IW02_9GAMA|nr:hypothetical protein [Otarine gammaherpesvirus 4]